MLRTTGRSPSGRGPRCRNSRKAALSGRWRRAVALHGKRHRSPPPTRLSLLANQQCPATLAAARRRSRRSCRLRSTPDRSCSCSRLGSCSCSRLEASAQQRPPGPLPRKTTTSGWTAVAWQASYPRGRAVGPGFVRASSAQMSRRRSPPLAEITRPVSMSNVKNQLPTVSQAPCGISTRAVEEDGALPAEVPAAVRRRRCQKVGAFDRTPHRFAVLEIGHDDRDRAGSR